MARKKYFSKVSSHMSRYGGYGIGLDKETVLNKYRIQPIQYINNKSPLADDFKQAFLTYLESEREIDGLHKVLSDYLISALVYMKPVWGYETDNNGNLKNYIYQSGVVYITDKPDRTWTLKQKYMTKEQVKALEEE